MSHRPFRTLRTTLTLAALTLAFAACSDAPPVAPADEGFPSPAFDRLPSTSSPALAPASESLEALRAVLDAGTEAGELSKGDAESLDKALDKIAKALSKADEGGDDDDDAADDGEKSKKSSKSDKSAKGPLADAAKKLDHFLEKLDKLEAKGRVPAALAAELRTEAARLEAALTGRVTPEAGGTVVADGGRVLIDIPAGALSTTVTITATPVPAPTDAPNVLGGTTYDFGPDGTQFATPVAVTFAYDPASVPDGLPGDAVFIVQNVGGVWERVPGPVTVDPFAGAVTAHLTHFSLYGVSADPCALRGFSLVATGTVTADDCDFQGSKFEELYRIVTADLVQASGQSFSDSPKLTLTTTTDFNGVIGFQAADTAQFGGLVHRFRNNLSPAAPVSFSMIAGEPEYKLFVGGLTTTDLGSYTVSTAVAPGGEYACGEVLVMAGSAIFSSSIGGSNACAGTIAFGPNVGQPLLYQGRYARLEAGKSYNVTVSGLQGAGPVALFVSRLPLSAGVDQELDIGGGPSDGERSLTFTPPSGGTYYIEVSTGDVSAPAVPYDFSFGEVTYDPCALKTMDLQETANISTNDCLFQGTQYEDIYRLVTADLVQQSGQSFVGSPKLTLTASTDFNGVLGFQGADPGLFQGLVHRFRNNLTPAGPVSFSMIGGEPEYKVFIGGLSQTELGSYTLSTTVAPGGEITCDDVLVMAGSAVFPSEINDANSCAGTIAFGPNVGQPLMFQPRYARLEAGKSYTISVTGIMADPVALFVSALPLSSGVDQTLDLSSGAGDPDRSVTFTASQNGFYYMEVSSVPGNASGYTLSFGPTN
jgi:hypothetical protein